jgi:molecular chaperone GrpE
MDETKEQAESKEKKADASNNEPQTQDVSDASLKIKQLQEELERCRKERDEYLAGWQRARADFINYQKEESRRQEEFAKWALSEFINDILPIMDSFEIAIRQNTDEVSNMGLRLIQSQLMSVLSKYGLEVISAEKGMLFNPEFHEAISQEISDGPENIILEEFQKGYMLNKRVLRPSKVKVSVKKLNN